MSRSRPVLSLILLALVSASPLAPSHAQPPLDFDRGAPGAWQKLLKLRTTASLLHTTAHPDDEQGGMLALMSRGLGVRTAMLTLNRGEAGDNAIGPELFDALGLIRTEELRWADQYYGVDEQYYTAVADYGYSKRMDEALRQWDRDAVVRDMVRVIRTCRPFVVVSRWQGTARDGHGQHQAAGVLTIEAVAAAADSARYPELATEGIRPWRVSKLYVGGARENEPWTVRIDTSAYSPVLGDSYANVARLGLSRQRSQNGGRFSAAVGPSPLFYTMVAASGATAAREDGLFDGIDTTVPGLYRALGRQAPAGAGPRLAAIADAVDAAAREFSLQHPEQAVPALVRGLAATRAAIAETADADAAFVLRLKERQFADAITSALGAELTAVAQPVDAPESASPFAPLPTLDPATPGRAFAIRVAFVHRGATPLVVKDMRVSGGGTWRFSPEIHESQSATANVPIVQRFATTVPSDAPISRPYFDRTTIRETRYTIRQPPLTAQPWMPPALEASVQLAIDGVPLQMHVPVQRREANLPYGYVMRDLEILPPISVAIEPRVLVIPTSPQPSMREVSVVISASAGADVRAGTASVEAPEGWTIRPEREPFTLEPGQDVPLRFTVTTPAGYSGSARLRARAEAQGPGETSIVATAGFQTIRPRDLPTRYLFRDASSAVSVVDLAVPGRLRVGYVMGIGDEVPAALAQLDVGVTLLGAADLATGDLSRYDAIITGTRAYAVREDLRLHTPRLLAWVRDGGNLIVLYNTPEFVPGREAPFPADLPASAEEVSEEDAPVEILAPGHAVLTHPNAIGPKDFEGWVEQRGSKFFYSWDAAYTPIVSSHDQGQAPQRGGWLYARYGKGHYTYMAYALHRQLPYGVPGAYRILANLLSLGRPATR
jgi:LmbE family N-acetylglucosaminyl deacetylase